MTKDNKNNFFDKIKKIFGDKDYCLTSEGQIYPVTVAINMLITLVGTLIITYCVNYFNILDYKYTVSELFLTCIVFFTIWNCIAGYMPEQHKIQYISTNTSLIISIFLLPIVVNGPQFLIQKIC